MNPILAALTAVLLDDTSHLRGPWRLWALARAVWVRPSSESPRDREAAARLQLQLVEDAGGFPVLAEVARVSLVRALLEQRRPEDAAAEVGWAWIAAHHLDAGRLHDAELAATRAGGLPAVMAEVHELRNDIDRALAAIAEVEARLQDHRAEPEPSSASGRGPPDPVEVDRLAPATANQALAAELERVRVRCLVRAGRFDEALARCDRTLLVVEDADAPEPVRAIYRLLEAERLLQVPDPSPTDPTTTTGAPGDRKSGDRRPRDRRPRDPKPGDPRARPLKPADLRAAAEAAREAFVLAEADPSPPERDWIEPLPVPRVPPAVAIRAAYLLGQALTALGDREGARAALETALGSCRDAVLVRGWDAVDPALEDRIAAALRVALS